jgi:hypothetical protein
MSFGNSSKRNFKHHHKLHPGVRVLAGLEAQVPETRESLIGSAKVGMLALYGVTLGAPPKIAPR